MTLYRVGFPFYRHHGKRNGAKTILGTGQRNLCSPPRLPHEINHTLQHVTTVCLPFHVTKQQSFQTASRLNGYSIHLLFRFQTYSRGTQPVDGGKFSSCFTNSHSFAVKFWASSLLDYPRLSKPGYLPNFCVYWEFWAFRTDVTEDSRYGLSFGQNFTLPCDTPQLPRLLESLVFVVAVNIMLIHSEWLPIS